MENFNKTLLENSIDDALSDNKRFQKCSEGVIKNLTFVHCFRIFKVILLSAFGRSGSSFLADLLTPYPGIHYWHEPLRFLYEKPLDGPIYKKRGPGKNTYKITECSSP